MARGPGGTEGGSLRTEHKQLTRAKLIDAARTLFAERGYTAVRVEDIAAAAGCGRATFYLHFTAKVDVLRALARDTVPSSVDSYHKLDNILGEDGTLAEFTAWIADALEWFRSNRELLSAWDEAAALEPRFSDDVRHSIVVMQNSMPHYLERWPAQRREEARLRVAMLVTQLERFFTRWAVHQTIEVSAEVAAQVLADIWFPALQAPAPESNAEPRIRHA
jgi:AcrR family transcriptional regulator